MKFIRVIKSSWSEKELQQVNALPNDAIGIYNIYQDKAGEIFITKHKLNNNYALMDTASTFDEVNDKINRDWQNASIVLFDRNLLDDNSAWLLDDLEEDFGDQEGKTLITLDKDYED